MSNRKSPEKLRVALVAGNLGYGGAEKQLFLMACALQGIGVKPVVYSLTNGNEPYEKKLRDRQIPVEFVGKSANRFLRLNDIRKSMAAFKPHIIQSGHFYTNIYAVLAARFCGSVGIGAVRSDVYLDRAVNGFWGNPSLYLPPALIVNSWNAQQNLTGLGVRKEKVHLVENVIDLHEFDRLFSEPDSFADDPEEFIVIAIAGLSPVKRLERFIMALVHAHQRAPGLKVRGVIVGNGPDLNRLTNIAKQNGLDGSLLTFLGQRDDVPSLLKQSKILVLTSDQEGFPNVLLEAMAAGLPVISTPAGDAPRVVTNEKTGFIVDFDAVEELAERIILLARFPALRISMGQKGRDRVERFYSFRNLPERLLKTYIDICSHQNSSSTASLIEKLYCWNTNPLSIYEN